MGYKPTDEQEEAISASKSGKTFKMSAYAGSGKTSTLEFIGKALSDKSCSYLAFNKSIATEAKRKFGSNVKCQTFHSLALSEAPSHIKDKLDANRIMPSELTKLFRLKEHSLTVDKMPSKREKCSQIEQTYIINRAVSNFCRSSDLDINEMHILKALPSWARERTSIAFAQSLIEPVRAYWEMCISSNPKYAFKISHDVYLKLWSMSDPKIDADTVFFDEAQDADPIMLSVLEKFGGQAIFVGDKYQQIYGFRGAENAMASLKIPEYSLTKSFRFGEAIAEEANLILGNVFGERVRIRGNENIKSHVGGVTNPKAFLCRTNSGAFEVAVQMMEIGRKPRIEIDLDTVKSQLFDAHALKNGEQVDKDSDFFGFRTWEDVIGYVEENPMCELAPFVRLAQNNNPATLFTVVKGASQKEYDCVISTAHKSKGLEFDTVCLHNDFKWNKTGKITLSNGLVKNVPLIEDDEARLLYVACTRAIEKLDHDNLSELMDQIGML